MKQAELIRAFSDDPVFESSVCPVLFDESTSTSQTALNRHNNQGLVHQLKQGVYCLTEHYRRVDPHPFVVANRLYDPSYISGLTILNHDELVTDIVQVTESMTNRRANQYETSVGSFDYYHLPNERFQFGTELIRLQGQTIRRAQPEKALLDFAYTRSGQWTMDRVESMRFQSLDKLNPDRLSDYVERYDKPKVKQFTDRLLSVYDPDFSSPEESDHESRRSSGRSGRLSLR